ncbi:MAG: DUF6110 family protein [Synergistaceae bacterium]|jgi:hypothetical protein|nr:DUF6110 family protein [Synergistaceae bacterium]
MTLKYEKALLFAAGTLFGLGTVWFVKSGRAKQVAVAVTAKGLDLKNCAAGAMERLKETMDDVVAEAQYVNAQKAEDR